MKRLSRLLTFVLAFVLCMSMGIATTLADDGPEAKWSADGGTWQEGTLMDAVWAAYGADAKIEIQLQRSVTLDASWYPQHLGYSGVELILDGQGFTIHRGQAPSQFFAVDQANSKVTLKDITLDGGAVWDNPANVAGRANSGTTINGNGHLIWIYNDSATLILEEGAVLQNNHIVSSQNGAGIEVSNGTLVMKNGSAIKRNTATGSSGYGGGGAGVDIGSSGIFRMEGGVISENYASVAGGGIYVGDGGSFLLKDGRIQSNAAGNNGGAISGAAGYDISLMGGVLTGNQAGAGGGITLFGDIKVGGGIQIAGNTKPSGTASNALIINSSKLLLTEPFETDAAIGIGVHSGIGEGSVAAQAAQEDLAIQGKVFLSSENDGFSLMRSGTQLLFTQGQKSYTVLFNANGGSAISPVENLMENSLLTESTPTKNNFRFDGWYRDAALTQPWNFDTDQVQENMILHAKWTPIRTVIFHSNGGSPVQSASVADGDLLARPVDPTRDGYLFTGWYRDADLKIPFDFSQPHEGDITLYAGWKEASSVAGDPIPEDPDSGDIPKTGDSQQPFLWAALSLLAMAAAGSVVRSRIKEAHR